MNKKELVAQIAINANISRKKARKVVNILTEQIKNEIQTNGTCRLSGLGSFKRIKRNSRRYFNIITRETSWSQEKNVINFTSYSKLRKAINKDSQILVNDDDGSLGNIVRVVSKTYHMHSSYSPIDKGVENKGVRVERPFVPEEDVICYEGIFNLDCYTGELDHVIFPVLKTPIKGTPVVRFIKDNIGTTVGIMEPILFSAINKLCLEIKGLKLISNVKIPINNRDYCYRPDICLYWHKYGLFIDIEIDEPYDIISRKPIHFTSNGDSLRDSYFTRNGWCVIRYSEQQVANNLEAVLSHLKRTLIWITKSDAFPISASHLEEVKRWTYEEAQELANNKFREEYLKLEVQQPQLESSSKIDRGGKTFIKPDKDILPELHETEEIETIKKEIKKIQELAIGNCVVEKSNGYKWIYTTESLQVKEINGLSVLTGESVLGIKIEIPISFIQKIEPLKDLFSSLIWINEDNYDEDKYLQLRTIIYNAIENGSPILLEYESNNSGIHTRYLSHLTTAWQIPYKCPHIGLGHIKKHGILGLSHFNAYCSYRKEFRMFALDGRVKNAKVLNCDNVYLIDDVYANSLAHLIMNPYSYNYGNAFFENASAILDIMPKQEKSSLYAKGNIANLQVLRGNIESAVEEYTQLPYNYLMDPNNTWGRVCISDIEYFINLAHEHISDTFFYEGLNASDVLQNFKTVLDILQKNEWMRNI